MKQLSLSLTLCLLFAASAHPQSIIEAIEMTANGAGPIVSGPVGFDVTTAPPGATSYSADWYRDVATGAGSVLSLPGGMQVAGGFYFVTAGLSGTNVAADHNTALNRWTRNGLTNALIEGDIYEMRFTAGPNQGWLFFGGNAAIPLPFEVWNLGEDPGDTSDDYRMVPAIAEFDGTGAFDFRHDAQIDPDVNDPVSDWIYFRNPVDTSPGDAGYNKAFPAPNTRDANEIGPEIMGRIVLMNYNQLQGGGGVNEMPETGTIIRIHGGNLPPTCQPDVPNGKVWFKDGIGLQSVSVVSSLNANVTINPLTPGDELASADVSRIDTSVDGYVAFNVVDTGGLSRECTIALNNDEMIPHTVGNVGLGVHDNSTLGPTAGGPSVPDVSGTWPSPGGANHIFAAGLWIGAEIAGEKRVLDGGYSSIGDWSKIAGITMTEFNDGAQQIINTTFDDRYAGLAFPPFDRATTPVGLEVEQHSYSWSDAARDDFVIITYDIENTGASGNLTDLLVGLWADPDVGQPHINEAGYDASRGLLWVTEAGGGTSFVGFKLLSGPPHAAFAPTNSAGGACSAFHSDDVDQYDRFLNGGLPVLCPYPSDVKTSLTAQPFDLASGERNRIGFGMVFGADLTDLQANADEMQSVYDLEVGPIAVTVREINALHPDSLAKLEANSPPLTLDDITRLTTSSYTGKSVSFTAVVLTEPHNSGLANTYPDGQPHRIHVFVRDTSAASSGFDGMSMQLVDSDYGATGLINVDPGDVIDIVGTVQPFNQTIQLTPLSIVDHGPFAGLGLPASIMDAVPVSINDVNERLGANLNRINWANFARLNNEYVQLINQGVGQIWTDGGGRTTWQSGQYGLSGSSEIQTADYSLRYRNSNHYAPEFNERQDFVPPSVGNYLNIRGTLVFRGLDSFNESDPPGAVFQIAPWEDFDVEPIEFVNIRQINQLDPGNLATLQANSPPLSYAEIADLVKSPYDGKLVFFNFVMLSNPLNSGLSGTSGGKPDRVHAFVRDPQAAGSGNEGMTIQLVDSDYENTGLLNTQFGDYGDIIGRVTYFGPTIQVVPQVVLPLYNYASTGLPASIVAPDTITTADLHINTGSGNRIDWNNFVRFNSGYVRLEDAEVTAVDGDVDRPHWLMTTDGGTTSIAKDDFSLRFRTGANYQPPFNKRSGPYTPPPVGANTNIQGFLTFRGHDPFGTGDPAQAVFSISPWKDSDVSIVQSVAIADVSNPPPVALPEVGLNIDFSSVEGAATVTVEQFTEEPDDLPGVFIPELGLFWTIDIDGATSFSTELCFSLAGLDPGTDPTTLQVLKRDESGEPWAQQNTTLKPNAINPTEICVSGITSFSDFAIGSFHAEGGGGGDISPYLLLASDTIAIGLATSVEGGLHSNGSILISDGPATYTSNLSAVAEISVGADNTVDGDAIAGGMITLGANTVVSGSVSEFDTVEPVPLPGFSISSGGSNVSVPKSGSMTLPPGSYGAVEVAADGTIRLAAGTYNLSGLTLGRRALVDVNLAAGPVTINVTDTLVVDSEVATGLSLGPAGARFVTLNVSDANVVGIGKQATMHLLLNAPGSVVMLDKETEWVGTIAARSIRGDKDLRLTHPSALEPTDALAKGQVDADGVEDELPQAFSLEQNYPNPFNPTTTIGFDLPEPSFVRLSVFDVLGREVNPLIARELKAGRHQIMFDARSLSSGTYLYRIEAGQFVQTKRMIVVK